MFYVFCLRHPFFTFFLLFFFFIEPGPTEIYTLSLHDALPISGEPGLPAGGNTLVTSWIPLRALNRDRKSTRLNSSHRCISYAVFCLKKKKKIGRLTMDMITSTRVSMMVCLTLELRPLKTLTIV